MESFLNGAVLTVKSSDFPIMGKSVNSETYIESDLIRNIFRFSGKEENNSVFLICFVDKGA